VVQLAGLAVCEWAFIGSIWPIAFEVYILTSNPFCLREGSAIGRIGVRMGTIGWFQVFCCALWTNHELNVLNFDTD
jgi:hypothetical protein